MRVHLVDGTYELFRAHFSKRPSHQSPQGKDLKASVGVVQSLLTLLEDRAEAVTHLAVAFDNPIVSFRNRLFDGYKTDAGIPPELRGQFDDVERAARALGVVVWSMDEFEADDALATAAVRYGADPAVTQVRVLTPDKDLNQVLRGEAVVQVDRMRNKLITEASLKTDKGIAPRSVPDWLALTGDTADGIPGLEGWGAKSATAVLGRYPRLEEIPPSPAAWEVKVRSAEALSAALEAHREQAVLYRTLATLRTDVPLAETLAQLEWKGAPKAQFLAWCDEVGATTLKQRPGRFR
jgi:5'-3' exonuclease